MAHVVTINLRNRAGQKVERFLLKVTEVAVVDPDVPGAHPCFWHERAGSDPLRRITR